MFYAHNIIRYRKRVLLLTLCVVILSGLGLSRLKVTSNVRYFFSEQNPQLKALKALEDVYSREGNIFFAVAVSKGDVFTKQTLHAIDELTQQGWTFPYSLRSDSIINYQYSYGANDSLIVGNLVNDIDSLSGKDLSRIKSIALTESLLINRLLSEDGQIAGVNILTAAPEDSADNIMMARLARDTADRLEAKYPHIKIYITGGVMIDNAFYQAAIDDMIQLLPIMFLIMIVTIYFMLRSISAVISTLVVMAASSIVAMGLAGWLGITISPTSGGAPVIILTLAVADSVHILTNMFHHLQQKKDISTSLIESLKVNFQPVTLTSLTTATGFLSMNFSDAPPFHDLGNIVAIGVMTAYLFSITTLPALMSILPMRAKGAVESDSDMMEDLGVFIVKHKKAFFYMMSALIIVLCAGLTKNELSDSFVEYFDETYRFRTDTDFVEDRLTGFNIIEYSLSAGEEGGIFKPSYLEKVEEFGDWFSKQAKVSNVNTIVNTLKRLNKNMHSDDPSFYIIPENRELAAQYMLLYELSLPQGLDINSRINLDKSASRFSALLKKMSTKEIAALEEAGNRWLEENAPPHMRSKATGLSTMFAHISERNIKTMLGGTTFALILISGILIVALKSVKIGLISLAPNLVPPLMTFGLWGLTVGEMGLAVSVIAAISLGIVVDDTVHFLSKYNLARKQMSKSPEDAVKYAFKTVGKALFTTSAVIALGFIILTFSGFNVNASMGLLTAITVVFALLTDFFFLPPLLMKIDRDEK